MFRIVAVAVNTFREAVRDKVLYGVLAMALLFELFALALGEMALDQGDRVVLDISLAALSLFSVIVAIFLGSSLLYKEIDRKTLYVILPKPLKRHEFLLGKYLGIVLTALVFISLAAAMQVSVSALRAGLSLWHAAMALGGALGVFALLLARARDRTAMVVPWSLLVFALALLLASGTEMELWPVFAAIVLVLGEVLLLTAVAMFFSAFSTPFLTALSTSGTWLVGRSADTMATLRSSAIPEPVRVALRYLAEVWPNFHLFVPGRHTLTQELTQQAGATSYTVTTMVYGGCYAGILLFLAALVFRRRDFI